MPLLTKQQQQRQRCSTTTTTTTTTTSDCQQQLKVLVTVSSSTHPYCRITVLFLLVIIVTSADSLLLLARGSPSSLFSTTTTTAVSSSSSSSSSANLAKLSSFSSSFHRGNDNRMTSLASSNEKVGSISDNNSGIDESTNSNQKVRILGVCGGIGSGKSTACRLLVSDLHCMAHIDADTVAHDVYRPGSRVLEEIAVEFGSDLLIPFDQANNDDNNLSSAAAAAATISSSSSSSSSTHLFMLDRKKLGSIVFSNPQSMSKLERIVWPHVRTELLRRIEHLQQPPPPLPLKDNSNDDNDNQISTTTTKTRRIIVVEAAVLLDAGWEDLMDGVWLVTASRPTALQRLTEQRGLTLQVAEQRIEAQQTRRIATDQLPLLLEQGVVTAVIENDGSLEELKAALEHALDDDASWKPSSSQQ